ncbi:MAG: F0F1 ATP synthase subunit A [Muribaculaceae bacterium]|nr:F0F1 ATP synthase subunit A [Muribaculaceae bacterium]
MKKVITALVALVILALMAWGYVQNAHHSEGHDKGKVEPKEIIFEHLGDAYGWEVPFSHTKRIPLPIIAFAQDGSFHCFMSSKVTDGDTYKSGDADFKISTDEDGGYKGKLVQVLGDGSEYRPWDFSITKNVLGILIAGALVILMTMSLRNWYKREGFKGPKGFKGMLELVVEFVYTDTIKPIMGKEAPKYGPYLLTAFFFILTMNLLGLIVIFPGGANLTGNLAVTMVLALITFFVTNLTGTKHYWKDIFWPDVPIALKCPVPMMPLIEFLGILTKPLALMVRLFANMLGGHMVVIVLIVLIMVFTGMFGVGVGAATSVVSVLLSLFMLVLDTLISFIQAFVFTLLSTIFISMAHIHEESKAITE